MNTAKSLLKLVKHHKQFKSMARFLSVSTRIFHFQEHNIPSNNKRCSCSLLSSDILQPHSSHASSGLSQMRRLCTREFDLKNDPEAKSILNEIISDFESARKKPNTSDHGVNEDISEKMKDADHHDQKDKGQDDEVKYQADSDYLEDLFPEEQPVPPWAPPISLERGTSGVFEVDELVELLEKENGRDITVINIPPEARFADHMVIVSALSVRHLRSMSSHVKWIHKRRKGHDDAMLKVEGLETALDWHAMDLGNIILHLFMPETREKYDLETLWTNWGQADHVEVTQDPYEITPEDDFWKSLEPGQENK